jgi:hypothetical protein
MADEEGVGDGTRTHDIQIHRRNQPHPPMAARALPLNNLQQFASLRKVVRNLT